MTLVCDTPSFQYTRHEEEWHWVIFLPLLMRHGPPPPGVKWYGKEQRVHFIDAEARKWQDKISADCKAAVESAYILEHYKPNWREMHALHIKNRFIGWCRDERNRELDRTQLPSAARNSTTENTGDAGAAEVDAGGV